MPNQDAYIEQWWKQQYSKKAYIRMIKVNMRVYNVAQCLAAGGNPATDPSVKDDYFYLVDEYGIDILNEAVTRIKLQIWKEKYG